MLREVVLHGTGCGSSKLNHPLGGKTGTTNDFTDAWFVGFSPSMTCGVWVGFDEKKTLGNKETGAVAALPIWMDFMRVALQGTRVGGLRRATTDRPTRSPQKVDTPRPDRRRRGVALMRRFFRWLVRVLVLIVVFMASALTAMRFAIHGRQTTVPKIVGMTPHEAETALGDQRTCAGPDRPLLQRRNSRRARIISQVPLPGEQVRRGWRVRVAESMGPQRVVDSRPDGRQRALSRDQYPPARPRDGERWRLPAFPTRRPTRSWRRVLRRTPSNVSAPKVSVLVAATEERKSFVMPDLRGRTEDDAVNEIVGAGLKVGSISSQPPPNADAEHSGDLALRNADRHENGSRRGATRVGRPGHQSGSDAIAVSNRAQVSRCSPNARILNPP